MTEKYFKSEDEFFGVLDVVRREAKKPGTDKIAISGSIISKGVGHRDVDLLVVRKGAKPITINPTVSGDGHPIEVFTTNPHFIKHDLGEAGNLLRGLQAKERAVWRGGGKSI